MEWKNKRCSLLKMVVIDKLCPPQHPKQTWMDGWLQSEIDLGDLCRLWKGQEEDNAGKKEGQLSDRRDENNSWGFYW